MTSSYLDEGRVHVLQDKHIPDFVTIFRIHGPFLFGTTDKLHRVIDALDELPAVVIFRLRNMTAIDATGLRALEDVALRLRESGRTAIFCGAREQPRAVMAQAGFPAIVGVGQCLPQHRRRIGAGVGSGRDEHSSTVVRLFPFERSSRRTGRHGVMILKGAL